MGEVTPPKQKKELIQSAEAGLQNKKTLNLNVHLKKLTSFLDTTKNVLIKIYRFFRDNKNNSKMMLFLAVLTAGIAIYFALQLIGDINSLKTQTPELYKLKTYDIHALQENDFTQPIIRTSDNVQDLLEEHGRM